MPKPSAAAREAGRSEQVGSDKLTELKTLGETARNLEEEIAELEQTLKDKSAQLENIYIEKMPDLMMRVGVDHLGVPPKDNHAGMDFKLSRNINANIAASWPEEKRQAGFSTLRKLGAEDLIKADVKASLPRGKLDIAKKLVAAAMKLGVKAELKEMVAHGTLSAWLRERYGNGQHLAAKDLEAIGGFVGSIVRPANRETEPQRRKDNG